MVRIVLFAAAILAPVAPSVAQLPETRFATLFPPGGQAGTTFEVRIAGEQELDYATTPRLVFSHPEIQAEAIVDPATGAWRDNAFRITVPEDVPPGRYDVQLAGYYGASPPKSFLIDAVPSQVEAADATESTPIPLAENRAVYGRIGTAADVDVFTFAGTAGATVVFRCDAALLDSPLQPLIELFDPAGRRLHHAGGPYSEDALLPIVLPAAGEYRLRVNDAAYRGSSDSAYRIEAAVRPVVTSIWPPFGQPGAKQPFEVRGFNLPDGVPIEPGRALQRRVIDISLPSEADQIPTRRTVFANQADADGFDCVIRDGEVACDPIPLYFATTEAVLESKNDDPSGQALSIPSDVAGRFETRNDSDRYAFDAKAGETLMIDVAAKRYGSAADPVVTLDQITGPDGQSKERRIAAADDRVENLAPGVFDTATDDPILRFDVPENGRYRITIRDRYFSSRGDDALFYRLSVRPPQPDFRLVVVPHRQDAATKAMSPDAVNLRKGENVAVPVYLIRRDGFAGPVRVSAQDLPAGLTVHDMVIAEGQTSAKLVLSASSDAAAWLGPVTITGEAHLPASSNRPAATVQRRARIGTVVRGAANQSTASRIADSLVVALLDDSVPFRIAGAGGEIRVGQGSQVLVPLSVERSSGYAEPIAVSADGLAADAKITTEMKPFAPPLERQLVRLLIDPQAPARSHSIVLQGTAKIDVAKFPHRLARATAAADRARQAFATADATLKTQTATREKLTETLRAAESTLQAAADADKPPAMAAVEAAKAAVAGQEAAVKSADESRKQAEAARTAAEKVLADAGQAAAVQKIDHVSPASPVTLTVVPSPVTLTATVSSDGQVKRGESVEVKVTAGRKEGFTGPIRLSLTLPDGTSGLSAAPVTVEAGIGEAVLLIQTTGDAVEGGVSFPAVRAVVEQDGPVTIDVPITLTVVP